MAAAVVVVTAGALVATAGPASAEPYFPFEGYHYEVVSRSSNGCLQTENASMANDANVLEDWCDGVPGQRWRFQLVMSDPATGVWYELRNVTSNLCLTVRFNILADGSDVRQFTCNGSSAQRWQPSMRPDRYLEIKVQGSGKCLDLDAWTYGWEVAQWGCHGGWNQQWWLR
jgi:hypothetical protein